MSQPPHGDVELGRRFPARSASMSIPIDTTFERDEAFISHTGPLRAAPGPAPRFGAVVPIGSGRRDWAEHTDRDGDGDGVGNVHLMRSGPLGVCDNPDCTTCPARRSHYRERRRDRKLRSILYGDTEGWRSKLFPLLSSYFPIMNPHTKKVQQWNKFFVISCLVAIFIDPLFFFLLSVLQKNKCIVLNWTLGLSIAAVRSVTDFIYLMHMVLQFRLAYVAPESRVVGTGDLVDQPKKIALNYLRGYFTLDLFVVLPLPQVMILVVLRKYLGASAANYAKNLLRYTVLLQYVPRIIRFLPFLGGESTGGFIFESAWANFVINLLMFVLAGHVVGSCWYLFGLQRVNQCLHDACNGSNIFACKSFLDCGRSTNLNEFKGNVSWSYWLNDSTSSQCFNPTTGSFSYGIYQQAVLLTTQQSVVTRYVYSLFWGFQQISTLAGNLIPSYFEGEVLFTMSIVGLGLLLFALLIGNMQNFLQALGRRKLEMQLRQRDVEQWMSHRRLPEDLRRQVRLAERYTWAATRGVNEEELLENLPENLQREIRRHFFNFLKKVRIFSLMDEPILDAICERLRQKLYMQRSNISYQGGPVEKMVFIVRGRLESIGADGNIAPLSEGDVCGEELLTWYLEHSTDNKDGGKIQGHRLTSTRTVTCLTNVEAFALSGADLEEVTAQFSRFLRNSRVQGAIRYQSPYLRNMAATRIQVGWRYRQRCLKRKSSTTNQNSHSNLQRVNGRT